MLRAILKALVDRRLTTVRELSAVVNVAPSTVYRWLNGQSEPPFSAVHRLARDLPHPDARAMLLNLLAAGAPSSHGLEPLDPSADPNVDPNADQGRRVDVDDALDAAIKSVRAAGESLLVVREACKDGRITHDEAAHVLLSLERLRRQCQIASEVVTQLAEPARRQALNPALDRSSHHD